MSLSGHADPNVFKRYNVRRDALRAEAAATPTSPPSEARCPRLPWSWS